MSKRLWFIGLLAVGVISLLLWWLWHTNQLRPSDESERPPIIISDGSVLFTADADTQGDHGDLVQFYRDGWYHIHGTTQGPKRLTVMIANSPDCNATNTEKPYDAKDATVHYDVNGTPHKATIVIKTRAGSPYLVISPETSATPLSDYQISVDGARTSIELKLQGSGNVVSCQITKDTTVRVRQPH